LICIYAGCSEKLEGDFIMCLGGGSKKPAVSEDEKIAEENSARKNSARLRKTRQSS
jgi:hypothetical protein